MEIGKNYFVIDFNYAASSFNKCIFLSGWHMRFRQHHLIREMLHK